jgi:hypothetical protein
VESWNPWKVAVTVVVPTLSAKKVSPSETSPENTPIAVFEEVKLVAGVTI